jgi:hypothetical protein
MVQTTFFLGAQLPWIPAWAGISVGLGLYTIPSLSALVLLRHRHVSSRAIDLDDDGVSLGRTETWKGYAVPWRWVEGFRITGNGIMLQVEKEPWTRWLGPTIRCDERLLHDIVVELEKRKIFNLEG